MNEFEHRRRPSHGEDPARGNTEKEKSDFFLTGFQIVVCIICLVVAFGIKQFGGGFYDTAKVYVTAALSDSITNEQVSEVFDNIRDALPSASKIFSSGIMASSSSSETSKQSTSSSNSSNSSSTKTSSANKTSTSSAKVNTASTSSTKTKTSQPSITPSGGVSTESLRYSYQ